jgi:nicotinate-nucleotide pyrophosphorylase (carboxylating)
MLAPDVEDLISRALAEDVGPRDVTTEAVVDSGQRARGLVVQKAPGMVYGLDVAEAVFLRLDPLVRIERRRPEGEWLTEPPADVLALEGEARALVTAERVALNLLGHLSGVATATAACVYELRGTDVKVLDTRKTTPALRSLEKQAVAAGGGHSHRMGLFDAILVKDNHIALAGGIEEAVRRAIARRPEGMAIEVECGSLADVEVALAAGAQRLLLDNMAPAQLREAASLVAGRAELEASGNITLQTLQSVGASGVQSVSLGFLTHSAPALDVSMSLEPA